tara:strand:- start:45 stop:758 length:714 start_codon:yes stop_codon:yes gene_type:complete
MEISFNTKTALSLMSCNFGIEITKELNDHIESVVIPENIDASGSLVGQINRNENSAQLIFPHDDDDVGEEFSEYLCRLANQYMEHLESDVVTDGSGMVNKSVKGNEKAYNPKMKSMWVNRSYEGDYNPEHDHPSDADIGLSCIMYLTVPIGISAGNDNGTSLNGASGLVDGYTRFSWGHNSTTDMKKLKPSTQQYIKPEVGQLIMFPSWLHHSVLPFFGDGERRSFSANINMYPVGE